MGSHLSAPPGPPDVLPRDRDTSPDLPFEQFYRDHVDRIHRALALAVGDSAVAREATDEAMARAYARWDRVRRLDNPGGWVFRVGLNWATSWWRKVRRERPPAEDRHPATAAPDPAGLAARSALERLPAGQRTVIVCRVLLDLSTAETAAVLDLTEGTVRSRLSRGLAELRAALAEEE
ncbi:sigma-70 family RNA polymerase sigma factor [Micromonospora terminaliae]|uniref:Sigma-70 family RNA polymerase sigma factor n=1 Tax=Micromonospora terminaliae TaxID=1914461 RepID=A0AAJ3DL62_9ACTN|nr:sigma-70 family RNA polymerase sigma factor [Micromonospora terminaliae]NES30587.1 sigma-70 family RNA polymerase sigma factor [Micromonospora terminaliae]QGL49595.1 sigma-70 family RNA polymerase sigma factor [Micromonospora terminaliae]